MEFVEFISDDKNRKLYKHNNYSILVSCPKKIANKMYEPTISLVTKDPTLPKLYFDKRKKRITIATSFIKNVDEMRKIMDVVSDLEKAILDNYDDITKFDEYFDATSKQYKKL